jgi:hypothetical protein
LPEAGASVLRYDKRGVGASGAEYLRAGMDDRRADARAAHRGGSRPGSSRPGSRRRDLLQLSGLRHRPELRDLAERLGVLPYRTAHHSKLSPQELTSRVRAPGGRSVGRDARQVSLHVFGWEPAFAAQRPTDVIRATRFVQLTSVIAAAVVAGGGIWAWRALEPPGWHPGFGSHRLAIHVSWGCPDPLPSFDTVANRGGGAASALVPRHPVAALICRYGPGQPGSSIALYRQVRLGPAPASAIASAADSIRSEPPPSGPVSCPDAISSVTLLGFSYRGGGHAALRWQDSGCEEVDNSNLAAFQWNSGFGTFQSVVDAVAAPRNRAEG